MRKAGRCAEGHFVEGWISTNGRTRRALSADGQTHKSRSLVARGRRCAAIGLAADDEEVNALVDERGQDIAEAGFSTAVSGERPRAVPLAHPLQGKAIVALTTND